MNEDENVARSFGHPPVVRTVAIWVAVSSVAAAASAIALRLNGWWQSDILTLLSLGFCAASLGWSIVTMRGAAETFVTGPEGLWHHTAGRPAVFLRWEDVGDVYSENVLQHLVVTDRSGKRRFAIEFHMQGFSELRRIIQDKGRRRG